ncbi:MAG TPA: VWA domain-containing protein [Terriglobales bacterium]|jgi:Ca-activated chloride channel family protein|nr:VWA domain-containing protein [Terriglobales bacterium]
MIAWSALQPSLVRLAVFCYLALAVLAQHPALYAQSADDVHITPRSELSSASSPEPDELSSHTRPLRKDVDLVLVPVTVSDVYNHPVLSLKARDFALYEGQTEQEIRYFSHEDAPISVGLVLDCSASMKKKIEYERQALQEFFDNANSDDEYFAVAVSNKPRLIASAADSVGTMEDRLTSSPPHGRTALFDAIYLAISKMRSARYQRRALLIISDGGDNTSRYTREEIKKVIEEADVLTYAIGIFDEEPIPLLRTIEEKMGRDWLSELTDASGGRTIAADDRRKIPDIAAIVSRELRSEYVLGYRPSDDSHNGKWRKITVKVAQPSQTVRLQVHYKEGYRAPTE